MRRTRQNTKLLDTANSAVNLAGDSEKIMEVFDEYECHSSQQPGLMLVDQSELMELCSTAEEISLDAENVIAGSENCEENEIQTVRESDEIQIIEDPAKLPKFDHKGRGRTLDPVWENFIQNKTLAKSLVQCKFCGSAVSNKVIRLKNHLAKNCMVTRGIYEPKSKSDPAQPSNFQGSQPGASNTGRIQATNKKMLPLKKKPQSSITTFVDRMGKTEQEELDLEIGKYIFSSNLPFSHVENPAFGRLIRKFRPACTLPSRRRLGNHILNTVYKSVKREQDHELFGKTVTIMQDGWKTRTSEPIIAHSLTTGEKSYFFKATNAEENVKTAKYCAKLLYENIEEVTNLGANVIAVVTDNCKSMEKMRKLITEKFPEIYTYGCHPHLLNLVGKKFTPEDIMEKVQLVHNFFRSHDAAWALLRKKNCGRPSLPSETRWNAWIVCFQYYLDHHAQLLEVSRNPVANCTDEICDILNDGEFYSKVKLTAQYLKPIQVALDKLQRENASIADGVDSWLQLKSELGIRDIQLKEYFDKQFSRALQPVGIGAHMLNPVYRGCGLSPDLIELGNKFLSGKNPFYVILAAQLKQKDAKLFAEPMFAESLLKTCSADTWWKSLESLEKIDRVSIKFAASLMTLPAGSADIERHFSVLGNIMNVRRSRLGIEKAAKLCIIYKKLAGDAAPEDDGGDWDMREYE